MMYAQTDIAWIRQFDKVHGRYIMKKKILLVDYYGTCDEKGKPIGHSAKVLKEYSELINDEFEIGVAISPCLRSNIDNIEHIYTLKYDICAYRTNSIFHRILDKFKLFANIKQVLKIKGYDIIWFYRTDFFLFLYFFLHRKRRKEKMISQIYQDKFSTGFVGKILNFIYYKGASRFDGQIFTQPGMNNRFPGALYIPDYYYDEEKYGVYKGKNKIDKFVCLGTMNPYKKLEELVYVFNKNGKKLDIKGYFYSEERFQKLLKIKNDNIIIENKILSEQEYYDSLAEAKYSILPYDMDQYNGRTSGILQESLFMDAVIVAPCLLLEQNDIAGIGYDRLDDLIDFDNFEKKNYVDCRDWMRKYDKNVIKNKVQEFFNNL